MQQYTLSDLCSIIDETIQFELAENYWVRAEIASLTVRGHCYLELVEKASNNNIAAKMRATCWSHIYNMLAPYFMQETGQSLAAGMQVLLQVEVQFHAVYGMSLNIIGIDPTFTIGDLARQRQATIQRLQDDGVFEMQKQLSLPTLPRRIAVISAEDAAGYGDFCHQLTNNRSGFKFHIQLFPATMQGDTSPASIIRALAAIANHPLECDLVVLVRGGGATTDLRNFDDYELANHCAQFPTPIIAGIGHTRDVSVVDMVVHTSVKTPTAVAEWIILQMQKQADHIQDLHQRLLRCIQSVSLRERNRINHWNQRLLYATQSRIQRMRNQLSIWNKSIDLYSPERIYKLGYSLTTINGKIVKSAQSILPGDTIQTHTIDGVITSQVLESTQHKEP